MRRALATTALLTCLSAGCSAPGRPSAPADAPGAVALDAGGYAAAFEAARDVLRAEGFELRRVDAREGVITTAPLASAGFFTPWIGAETTLGQSVEGSLSALRRTAEVRFAPVGASRVDDLRAWDGPLTAAVTVIVERPASAPSRLSPVSITLTSRPINPLGPDTGVFAGQDTRVDLPMTERLAASMREKL